LDAFVSALEKIDFELKEFKKKKNSRDF